MTHRRAGALVALLVSVALLAGLAPRTEGAAGDYAVFVHGQDFGTNFGPLEWGVMAPAVEAAGFEPVIVNLPGVDNVANAAAVRDAVLSLPAGATVHVIGHSMGGLSARYYVRNLGGLARVESYIGLDAPEFGSWKGLYLCWQCLPISPFIVALNAGDPTPGDVTYVQLALDFLQPLPGAYYVNLTAPGRNHRNIVTDPGVIALVIEALDGDYSAFTRTD